MSCDTGNKNSDVIGILEESVFNVAEVSTFTTETVNPLIASASDDDTDVAKGYTRAQRGSYGKHPDDFHTGLKKYPISITGDIRANGYDFALACFNLVREYDTDHMVYKNLDEDMNCLNKSFTIWIPENINGVRYADRYAGCVPLTLEENLIEGTYTITFSGSSKVALTVANTIPDWTDNFNYDDANNNAIIQKSIGRVKYAGEIMPTDGLTYTITNVMNETSGDFGSDGERMQFNITSQETMLTYESPRASKANTTALSRILLNDRENNTVRDFEVELIADATHKIIKTFKAIAQEEKTNKAGAEYYTFTCNLVPTLDTDKVDMTTQIYGDYGDLTLEF